MKKIAYIASVVLMAISAQVQAGGTFKPGPEATPAQETIAKSTCEFLANDFKLTPSRNVGMSWGCNATSGAVNAGNIKGKYTYGGNTQGGSVKQCDGLVNATNGYGTVLENYDATAAAPDGCGVTGS